MCPGNTFWCRFWKIIGLSQDWMMLCARVQMEIMKLWIKFQNALIQHIRMQLLIGISLQRFLPRRDFCAKMNSFKLLKADSRRKQKRCQQLRLWAEETLIHSWLSSLPRNKKDCRKNSIINQCTSKIMSLSRAKANLMSQCRSRSILVSHRSHCARNGSIMK